MENIGPFIIIGMILFGLILCAIIAWFGSQTMRYARDIVDDLLRADAS